MSFSWTGRQLDSITKSDGTVVSFTYDANGMRTEKTVGDESFGYVWQNGKLIAESYEYDEYLTQYYIYDENGSPVAWSYLDEYYYYIKNQQGDILGFTDSEGNVVVTYEYDAWGNLLSYTGTWYLAEYNSLRYRGYAYDNETGLYYLQSRYYDPEVGRFLNADDTSYLGVNVTVLSYNLYTYCENNQINFFDPTGTAKVVIDPGHGGSDYGAKGIRINTIYRKFQLPLTYAMVYFEKSFNLNVALELCRLFRNHTRHTIYMTRTSDKTVSLDERYKYANDKKATIFISIHHNSSNIMKKGYSTLYSGKHDVSESQRLSSCISNFLGIHTKLKRYASPRKDTTLAVLNGTTMPAVLVECGYMGGDLVYCRDNYKTIATAIFKGICWYFDNRKEVWV